MDRRSKFLIICSIALALLATCVALWALFLRAPEAKNLPPDVLPPVDEDVLPAGEDDDEKLPQTQGGGAVNITYANQVAISLSDGKASLHFVNPTRSNQSMVLQIRIQDVVVTQSGALPPGSQLNSLPITEEVSLAPGSYNGQFFVSFYDTENNSRAQLSTEIPVAITVTS